jgi:FMN phosphatase YigB (HAD superfamily)
VLALDFDGVIADALAECAAVTWYAATLTPTATAPTVPPLPAAVADVPADFVALFTQVRAYSRTIEDFMVTHTLYPGVSTVGRADFQRARRASDPTTLSVRADAAERVRAGWRAEQFDAWVGLHRVHPQVAELLRTTGQTVVVISAKDPASIRSILAHHGLEPAVDDIIGSCHDKRQALDDLLTRHPAARSEGLTFVDDSIDNVLTVTDLPLNALWADWGYHGPEDQILAGESGVRQIQLRHLLQFTRSPRGTASPA